MHRPPPEEGWENHRPSLDRIEAAVCQLDNADSRPLSVYAAMELEAAARAYVHGVLDTPRPLERAPEPPADADDPSYTLAP